MRTGGSGNLSLNSEIYRIIQLVEANGDSIDHSFHIVLDENGNYEFDVTDFSLSRFRADVYGHSLIDDLKADEVNASPDQIMKDLAGRRPLRELSYLRIRTRRKNWRSMGCRQNIQKEELLKMVSIRYLLSTTSYQKYVAVTIATDVSEETVATIMENKNSLEGVDIAEDSVRVYEDSVYFSSLIGYTGKISAEELDSLREENPNYSTTSIVGKTGIEEVMETTLQGTDGKETVYVDNLRKSTGNR